MTIERIAITTGGGDAPGLNAVIRAATLAGRNRGWDVVGIRDGFDGLYRPASYPYGGLVHLTREAVRDLTRVGGTILGTTNRGNPLAYPVETSPGEWTEEDRTEELLEAFRRQGIDALITIGGDGSMAIAHHLAKKGLRLVGVPKTIDNDLDGTVVTFGFDTAVNFATHALDRLRTTARSHHRVMVVEVMGRYAGWIALHAGIAGDADVILIPEIPFAWEPVVQRIKAREGYGTRYTMVMVAEGARLRGGEHNVMSREVGRLERLGGVGEIVAAEIQARTGKETRAVVLGHLVRGGEPTTFDRLLALRFGAAAVRALEEGESDIMVALDPPTVLYVPLEQATHRMKTVPLDCDTMRTARDLGICFGDGHPLHA